MPIWGRNETRNRAGNGKRKARIVQETSSETIVGRGRICRWNVCQISTGREREKKINANEEKEKNTN